MAKPPRLFFLMSLAQHKLKKTADSFFKDTLGISMTQLGVLFLLEEHPGAMLKDLSAQLGVNASAITALVDRMEDAGLVQRKPSVSDERSQLLFATTAGLKSAAAARPILARLNTRLLQGFEDKEIEVVGRFLNSIVHRF